MAGSRLRRFPPLDAPTQYAIAYVLTSTAGLRAALTLLAVSLAVHWKLLPLPSHEFAWLASDGALAVLVGASVLEVLGDKIPLLDHGLHALETVGKPLAGAVVAGSIVTPGHDPNLLLLALLGGGNALAIHGASATVRAASTVTTGGLANPIVSALEDGLAIGGIALAWFTPYLGAACIALLTLTAALFLRRLFRMLRTHREQRAYAAPSGP